MSMKRTSYYCNCNNCFIRFSKITTKSAQDGSCHDQNTTQYHHQNYHGDSKIGNKMYTTLLSMLTLLSLIINTGPQYCILIILNSLLLMIISAIEGIITHVHAGYFTCNYIPLLHKLMLIIVIEVWGCARPLSPQQQCKSEVGCTMC